MYERAQHVPPPDPLAVILESANPAHLIATAKYHEHVAGLLRLAAHAVTRRHHNAVENFSAHEIARQEFLKIGARLAVLIRRGARPIEAFAMMKKRGLGWSVDQMRAALRAWRKARSNRRL